MIALKDVFLLTKWGASILICKCLKDVFLGITILKVKVKLYKNVCVLNTSELYLSKLWMVVIVVLLVIGVI